MAFYFIFWDGVGYGKNDPAANPFLNARCRRSAHCWAGMCRLNSFKRFTSDTVSLSPVNTTLRVPGLPQSGTGTDSDHDRGECVEVRGKAFWSSSILHTRSDHQREESVHAAPVHGKNVLLCERIPAEISRLSLRSERDEYRPSRCPISPREGGSTLIRRSLQRKADLGGYRRNALA
jgi:hypothetical protein